MRFNILLAVAFLSSLVSGLAISSRFSEREVDVVKAPRQFLELNDVVELAARAKVKKQYTVAAGAGRPEKTYSRNDVSKAIKDANKHYRQVLRGQRGQRGGISNGQARRIGLKTFQNRPHLDPKPGSGAKPLPNFTVNPTKPVFEYPLRTAGDTARGPARVILEKNNKGKLKFKGVVAHDQSRNAGYTGPGLNDHFQVKGTNRP